MTDRDRIIRYVRRFHVNSGATAFPTVRRVARALGLRQSIVEEECNDLPLMLTGYLTVPCETLGDHFVEICE